MINNSLTPPDSANTDTSNTPNQPIIINQQSYTEPKGSKTMRNIIEYLMFATGLIAIFSLYTFNGTLLQFSLIALLFFGLISIFKNYQNNKSSSTAINQNNSQQSEVKPKHTNPLVLLGVALILFTIAPFVFLCILIVFMMSISGGKGS